MTSHLPDRMHKLAATITELKVRVRTAMASEMAQAFGSAVRDVLVVALLNRLVSPTVARTPARPPTPSTYSASGSWRSDREEERDRWGDSRDHWVDDRAEYERERHPSGRYELYDRENAEERTELEEKPAMQTAAAVAVGVNVGRWWLARKGTLVTAIGAGVLATALGLAGGPIARAALAVLAAATDILTADTALSRFDHS